ncbi:MAG TPA: protoporphyrinogen oxidase [Terriglobales bacterium]|nr:protoporphyrinogen oxidase [Terriglobales bacterium]
MRIAIIGGGISGLTTAFYLEQERRKGAPIEFTIFEAAPRFGGVIQTERVDGCIIEAGPDSFLTSKPWARELCDDLRLSSQLIHSQDSARKTYILTNGSLEPIPSGMQMMVAAKFSSVFRSRLFSWRTKLAIVGEYLSPPDPLGAEEDESVASFVSRHFTPEVVDRLAEPLLSGIYGGDASRLSARSTLPQMVENEARYHSLVRGALAARDAHKKGKPAQPLFTTLRDGMQRMVDSLVRQLRRETLRVSQRIDMLGPGASGWQVTTAGLTENFDQVILALPTEVTAKLMGGIPGSERPIELLGEFSYRSAVTVVLVYKRSEISLPSGFGFLIPRSEGKRIMACTFVHNKFAHRAPEDTALLRVFVGGTRDPEIVSASDSELIEIVRSELCEILKLTAEPRLIRVFKWPNSMAQYEVGHMLRVARLEMHMQRFPGLHLTGNAYHGIGIPDCVRLGRAAADAIMRRMRAQRAPA